MEILGGKKWKLVEVAKRIKKPNHWKIYRVSYKVKLRVNSMFKNYSTISVSRYHFMILEVTTPRSMFGYSRTPLQLDIEPLSLLSVFAQSHHVLSWHAFFFIFINSSRSPTWKWQDWALAMILDMDYLIAPDYSLYTRWSVTDQSDCSSKSLGLLKSNQLTWNQPSYVQWLIQRS